MALETLNEIFDIKGQAFIKKLLNLDVTVSEKIVGSTIGFSYTDGEFRFFKKSGSQLTKIDYVLMKFYADAIKHFKTFPQDVLEKIAPGAKFMFEYFLRETSSTVVHGKIPKGSLMLTHIITEKTIIYEKTKLDDAAKAFNTLGPPVLFQGKLSDEQKDSLMEFIRSSKEQAQKEFGTSSFTDFIIKVLYNKDVADSGSLDSVIFSFNNGDDTVSAKLINPYLSRDKSAEKVNTKNDLLSLIFCDMIEYVETNSDHITNLKLKFSEFDDRYLEIISEMFYGFIKNNKTRYNNVSLTVPEFMQGEGFEINTEFITNKKVLQIIETDFNVRNLFKIFIALFRKKKKRVDELLNKNFITIQHKLVDLIQDACSKGNAQNESAIPIFSEICDEIFEFDLSKVFEKIEKDELIKETPQEIVVEKSGNSIYAFWQNAFCEKKVFEKDDNKKKVNLIIGKFQPFNNKHLSFIQEQFEDDKTKTIVICLNSKLKLSEKTTKELLEKIVKSESYSKIFESLYMSSRQKLGTIIQSLSEKYCVNKIFVSEKFSKFSKMQMDYAIFEGSSYNAEITPIKPREIEGIMVSSKQIFEFINDNDYKSFKKICPKELWPNFEQLRSEIK